MDRKPEEQGKMMIQSELACDNLIEEQHLVSFGSKDPETKHVRDRLKKSIRMELSIFESTENNK